MILINTFKMKKTLLLLISILSFYQSFSIDSLFNLANKEYNLENYDNAINLYNKVLDNNYESPSVYFNLGNCYFRNKNYVLAKINFEKAYKLNPSDENIKHNIEITNNFFVDNFNGKEFNTNIIDKIIMLVRPGLWGKIALVMIIISLIVIILFYFIRNIELKKYALGLGVILFLISILLYIPNNLQKNYLLKNNFSITSKNNVIAYSSPSRNSTILFNLHEGCKLKIVQEGESFYFIKTPNNLEGWIKKTDLIKI